MKMSTNSTAASALRAVAARRRLEGQTHAVAVKLSGSTVPLQTVHVRAVGGRFTGENVYRAVAANAALPQNNSNWEWKHYDHNVDEIRLLVVRNRQAHVVRPGDVFDVNRSPTFFAVQPTFEHEGQLWHPRLGWVEGPIIPEAIHQVMHQLQGPR